MNLWACRCRMQASTLHEVLNHPWMVKGYDGPPDPHIPHREPLRLSQLDPEVIKGMTGFEFGSAEKIEADLRSVLSSEITNGSLEPVYNIPHSSSSISTSPVSGNKRDSKNDKELSRTPKSSKRFSGFGFYSKKMAGGIAAVLNTVGGAKNDDKSNTDPNSSLSNGFESVLLNGQTLDSLDPTRGFHPLISIYFLVREKIERERIYGPGVFASSTLSVTGPPPPPVPPSAYRSELGSHGSQLASTLPTSNELTPASANRLPNKNRNTLAGSELDGQQRDQAALFLAMHQKGSTKGRNGLLSIRPSTATERMVSTPLPSAPNSPSQTAEFATSRPRNADSFNPSKRRSVHVMTAPESSGALQMVTDVVPSQRSPELAVNNGHTNQNARADRVVSMVEPSSILAGPSDSERSSSGFVKRFGSFLGRSSSVSDPDYKRQRPRSTIGLGHKSSSKTPLSALPQVTESSGLSPPYSPGGLQEQQQTASQVHQEHAKALGDATPLSAPISGLSGAPFGAISDSDTNTLPRSRHQRGSSISRQANEDGKGIQPPSSASSWRPRMTSLQGKSKRPMTGAANPATVLSESEGESHPLDEEGEVQPLEIGSPDSTLPKQSAPLVAFSGRTGPPSAKPSDKIKPIYLKGLFSVATTSTRGPQVLRADLVTVLNRIGFQHREIKGGFECAHAPSIDLSSYGGAAGLNTGAVNLSQPHFSSKSKRTESMKKKVSKASFGKLNNHENLRLKVNGSTPASTPPLNDRSEQSLNGGSQAGDTLRQAAATPSLAGTEGGSGGVSATGVLPHLQMTTAATGPTELGELSAGGGAGAATTTKSSRPSSSKNGNNNNNNNVPSLIKKFDLVVRFEIFIVKMPLLPGISGLQFRRISGNAWQYQTFGNYRFSYIYIYILSLSSNAFLFLISSS
ncbi:CAMK/CAMKL/KIN1 protein kinase [Puccinia sorghi]|uniref:non-specific serine/threonine protein kinase n=1 Tax=Puccinia sorghi TaxID=27349 RepID=A0A0L6UD48_9BASI|nr:CAMK/CAMKL/KIN1 protein kinase [Puccinia sorghi]